MVPEITAPFAAPAQRLAGRWRLALDPDNVGREGRWFDAVPSDAQDAPVPGIIQQVFPDYHGVAWYWHAFRPARLPGAGERALLRFGAVDYLASVWVNGLPAGGHEGGETPFDLDVTGLLRPGENLLAVRVLNPTEEGIDGIRLAETPHRNKAGAEEWMNFIYDPVNYAPLTAFVQYFPVVKDLTPKLEEIDPDVAANPLINPPQSTLDNLVIWATLTDEEDIAYSEIYAKVTSG